MEGLAVRLRTCTDVPGRPLPQPRAAVRSASTCTMDLQMDYLESLKKLWTPSANPEELNSSTRALLARLGFTNSRASAQNCNPNCTTVSAPTRELLENSRASVAGVRSAPTAKRTSSVRRAQFAPDEVFKISHAMMTTVRTAVAMNVFTVAAANKWLKSSSAFAKPKPMDAHSMFTAARTVCGLSEVSLASIESPR